MYKRKIYDINDIIDFGKYKGLEIFEICLTDPKYIDSLDKRKSCRFTNSVYYFLENIEDEKEYLYN